MKTAPTLVLNGQKKVVASSKKTNSINLTQLRNLAVLILVFVLGGLTIYFFLDSRNAQTEVLSDTEIQAIKDKLSKNIIVEGIETYDVGLIKDIEALKQSNPVFFKNAENGDALIVSTTQAIIFRPSNELIINVGPVTDDRSKVRIELRGTSSSSNLDIAEQTIEQSNENFLVVGRGTVIEGLSITPGIVPQSYFDENGLNQLKSLLNLEIKDSLPEEETNFSSADIVIYI